jgi:endo-1,3-1,4-beta-glycanase ExoK
MERSEKHLSPGTVAFSAVLAVLALFLAGSELIRAEGGGNPSGWSDDFSGTQLNSKLWVVSNGSAPRYIPDDHQGYFTPANVSVSGGYLVLKLTQQTGTVGSNANGIISYGGQVRTRHTYGYGTYAWTMRMSSTSATPTGTGSAVSGSVSAGFIYVNNSQTEIDFEFPGDSLDLLYMVNWLTTAYETADAVSGLNVATTFHTYKFVWQPGIITYYVDGTPQVTHTSNVPSAPAYFMMNHWGTDSLSWGGLASPGVTRYFYIDSVSYSP